MFTVQLIETLYRYQNKSIHVYHNPHSDKDKDAFYSTSTQNVPSYRYPICSAERLSLV